MNVAGNPSTMAFSEPRLFSVPSNVFRRFQMGKVKFTRWKNYLDLEDENQNQAYQYITKNRGKPVVLRDETTGAMLGMRIIPKSR